MKLFVIAAFIAVSSAGRLEHLEPNLRGYLPPSPGSSFGQGFGGHGAQGNHGALGNHGGHGIFGGNGAHGARGAFGVSNGAFGANSGAFGGAPAGHGGFNARASFGSPSNQYLPPNHGFSASGSDDSVSVNGFGARGSYNHQYGQQSPRQFGHHASSHGANQFGAQGRFQPLSSGVSRQYLAPRASQNPQQQPFNEQTGYQY